MPQATAVKAALSHDRFGTYERAVGKPDLDRALALYAWNAQISSAFLFSHHICEVLVRNAAATALTAVYGPQWPWATAVERSLPSPSHGYNMRADLVSARAKVHNNATGKIIAELTLKFWVTLFTQRFDQRLWVNHLHAVFPNLPAGLSVQQGRFLVHTELDNMRRLRNRIAHHEPIFARNLADDIKRVCDLIQWRCPITSVWHSSLEQVSAILAAKP